MTTHEPAQSTSFTSLDKKCRRAFEIEEGYGNPDSNPRNYRVFRDGFFAHATLDGSESATPASEEPVQQRFPSLPSNETLRRQIANDSDGDNDAGVLHPEAPQLRFYIEHGMIHDRVTWKHVTVDADSWTTVEGATMPNPHGSGITNTCDLLNSLVSQAAKSESRLAAETKARKIAELQNKGTLANNLCPDHRDKQTGKPCLACTIETLERKLAAETARADAAEQNAAAYHLRIKEREHEGAVAQRGWDLCRAECAAEKAQRVAAEKDAARFKQLTAHRYPQSEMDKWDGDMYTFSLHDPKCVGVEAALDAALATAKGEGSREK